jgi:chaperone required for assembly of F1-ATPase
MKRFYKEVSVVERGGAFDVVLDGKPIKTPLRKNLALPTRKLAEAVAEEWCAQGEEIKPLTMPFNRLANTAVDRGAREREQIVDDILRYANSDLLCYRTEEAELAERQRAAWEPVLAWLDETHRARLEVTTGMRHIAQPADALVALRQVVRSRDACALTALHAAATITGSLALGLALLDGHLDSGEAFVLSQLDEAHQAEKWGEDRAATERATILARELDFAARFAALSRP